MKEEYHKWYTNYLDKEFEMIVFGHSGYPVILFPTSQGRYYQNKDFKLIESASGFIDSGKIKIYCPDGIDKESWYNYGIHPADRVKTHNGYENVILNDVIAFAQHDTGHDRVVLGGCSFGGYHALNMALRFPHLVSHLISMGGAFDIKQFIMGYYDDNCYFNNPVDYLPGLNDPEILDEIRRMGIVLGTGDNDFCLGENKDISGIFQIKNISHWLDVVPGAGHDWPWWREMLPRYLAAMF